MNSTSTASFHKRVTAAGVLIAAGIVFGDIGTSPLYTLNAVFHGRVITEDVALGALSAIFWTLTFQTTLKYVIITLQADNKGEGGIFSLYALIRRYWGKWLLIPAMAGGAFLIADGIITPPISVASAVEGLQKVNPDINTVPIIIAILVGLFAFQQFGTDKIGKIFGPVMTVWFTFIGVLGVMAMAQYPSVLKALNPYYAYVMLREVPGGFWLLGSIFLCTTGAEALYSDMGHCGRNNIRVSWIYIKVMLILAYAGQTAWLLNHVGETTGELSPFFHIVPDSIYIPALIIATMATIIASQALISGCFTLINEAIRLDIWPRHRVLFPGNIKGQLYIPFINWFLMAGCIGMVLYFKESTKMEAAFGLSVTLTMIMSTVLINFYLHAKRVPFIWVALLTTIFLVIETSFLLANLQKIKEGGWITLVIGAVLFTIMFVWHKGRLIKRSLMKLVPIENYVTLLQKLSTDEHIPKYATNLVYLTASGTSRKIEKTAVDSILSGFPKRADIYWFVHVNVLDEPYAMNYHVDTLARNDVYFVEFNLGFRIDPRIDYYFKQVVEDMVKNKEIDVSERYEQSYQESQIGDLRFLVMDSFLSFENDMTFGKNFIMKSYFNLRMLSVKEEVNFGLDPSNVTVEKYPVVVTPVNLPKLTRR
ncbi:KUP/HAK/KT family potassium transporter [Pseudoflavitalea sp. G-6-1-2]|uniref:KUP/HAK/KT family potassium transporter n=1 Tax=Pseudoflavitalea sp. G-6-1-2 TaxID=2728841 RepID=UPI00146C8B67|nr:KUP/HAK/KT family potassium transporter [Pseudoflavitalea sp. G-6-1-2]NML23803.1 KUP/HAK/KT family potassium transporter [Pseudoflavitalea sp. G-6-1-2]